MGYGLEVDLIKAASALDLLTTPYVFDAEQARDMTRAGADIVVCHMGLTTGGAIGADTALALEECVPRINDWAAAARRQRKDVIILCHGGPIATPADAAYIMANCPECHGFYGASSMERLPTERAIAEQTRQFKRIAGAEKADRSMRITGMSRSAEIRCARCVLHFTIVMPGLVPGIHVLRALQERRGWPGQARP